MPTNTPLSAEQIDTFKQQGFLVVPGLIEPAYLDQWRSRIWGQFGGAPDRPDTWKNQLGSPSANFEPQRLRFHNHPAVAAIVEQLGGGHFVCGHDSCVTTWPQRTMAWNLYDRGHIDGYNSNIGWWPFMLSATTYLHDVPPRSGALTLWPQSHLNAWRYFRKKPGNIDGQYLKDPEYEREMYENTPPALEATARAGDVIFWHAFIVHNGSPNIGTLPRVGLFTRWLHEKQDEIKYEVPENLWKYWAI